MYVKPLIKVNSCLMVPPCSLAVSLALETVNYVVGSGLLYLSDVLINLIRGSSLFQGDLS